MTRSLPVRLSGRVRPRHGCERCNETVSKRLASEYPEGMNETSSRSLGRTVVAGLILLVAAWVLLHFVIGIVTAIASILVVVLAIAALIWALRVIF
jgi:preprotein translocase subunit SecF